MRALLLAVALGACATSPNPDADDFSWLEGFWRESYPPHGAIVWTRAEAGWVGEVRWQALCADVREVGSNCRFVLAPRGRGWTLRDETERDVATYRLVEIEEGRAAFQRWGHREIVMTVSVEDGRYSMIEDGIPIILVFWGDAEPC